MGTLDIVDAAGNAGEAEMDFAENHPHFDDHVADGRGRLAGAPKAAGQRVIAAAHRARIGLAEGANECEVAAGACAAAASNGEPVDGVTLAE